MLVLHIPFLTIHPSVSAGAITPRKPFYPPSTDTVLFSQQPRVHVKRQLTERFLQAFNQDLNQFAFLPPLYKSFQAYVRVARQQPGHENMGIEEERRVLERVVDIALEAGILEHLRGYYLNAIREVYEKQELEALVAFFTGDPLGRSAAEKLYPILNREALDAIRDGLNHVLIGHKPEDGPEIEPLTDQERQAVLRFYDTDIGKEILNKGNNILIAVSNQLTTFLLLFLEQNVNPAFRDYIASNGYKMPES